MGSVQFLPIRQCFSDYMCCGGCRQPVDPLLAYVEVGWPYAVADHHILLCESCYREATRLGVFGY